MTSKTKLELSSKVHKYSTFMITVQGNGTNVVFDTMGGYQLYPYHKESSEYERKLIFSTYDEAMEKIVKLQKDSFSQEVRAWNFAVLELEIDKTESIYQYEPIRTIQENDAIISKQNMCEFEAFYSHRHKSWSLSTLNVLRNANGTGYTHADLQKAFKAYLVLIRG